LRQYGFSFYKLWRLLNLAQRIFLVTPLFLLTPSEAHLSFYFLLVMTRTASDSFHEGERCALCPPVRKPWSSSFHPLDPSFVPFSAPYLPLGSKSRCAALLSTPEDEGCPSGVFVHRQKGPHSSSFFLIKDLSPSEDIIVR